MSRKLATTITAIVTIAAVVIGLAILTPAAITPQVVVGAIVIIGGLGGYNIARQATIDERRTS